jgi:hypothetical protein
MLFASLRLRGDPDEPRVPWQIVLILRVSLA